MQLLIIYEGKFEPYFPSEDIQAKISEIARNLGDPNYLQKLDQH